MGLRKDSFNRDESIPDGKKNPIWKTGYRVHEKDPSALTPVTLYSIHSSPCSRKAILLSRVFRAHS